MCCVKRNETLQILPFSLFIEIIRNFKIQGQEHVESTEVLCSKDIS